MSVAERLGMPPAMAVREARLVERMDGVCDEARLFATYRRFAVVNRAVSGWRQLYLRRLRPLLAARRETEPARPATLLDLGFGGGDVPRALARWARADGLPLAITAIDPDERAVRFARAARRAHAEGGIHYRQASGDELVRAGERYDVVVSNHVLHHLPDAALHGFLLDSAALARSLVLHADLERGRLAYALYGIGAVPFAPGSYVREDGLLSLRRSYTAPELAAAVPSGWRVERPRAFRLLARWEAR